MSSMEWSTTSLFSAYSGILASAMLLRSMKGQIQSIIVQLIPESIREKLFSKLVSFFGKFSTSETTLIIDELLNGISLNEVYHASQLYLQDKISPLNKKLKVAKSYGDKKLSVTLSTGEEIADSYQGIKVKWVSKCTVSKSENNSEKKINSFELSFSKEHREVVLGSYLSHIMELAKVMKEANRSVKLRSLSGVIQGLSHWKTVNLDHPSTFDTLAMDPMAKKAIMDDLDRFVGRKEYYRRVGKAWKRGYLLYGPPGTGKSSLIAAMANYLKFNIYDLELSSVRDNQALINMLMSTHNRSMIVIEDIDCSVELQNRKNGDIKGKSSFTLSGLLNFIDGLWSSFGDQKIIVFTTNYKEKLDPALLRPGRMDMHIHMSYLTPEGFKVLAFNYLGVSSHPLFSQIENLISNLEITPATVAEELMKDEDDPNATLQLLLEFLQKKKSDSRLVVSKPVAEVKAKSNQRKKVGTIEHEPKVKDTKTRVKEV